KKRNDMRIMNFAKNYIGTFITLFVTFSGILAIVSTGEVNAKADCECRRTTSCPSGGVTPSTCLVCDPGYQPPFCYCNPSDYLICLRPYLEECTYVGGDPNGKCNANDCYSGCTNLCVVNCGPCAKYVGTCPNGDPYQNQCLVTCKYVYKEQVPSYP
ncbi:MAG: hypothetical protein ACP5KS_15290, partial [Candidatus Hydrogenedens sp.]